VDSAGLEARCNSVIGRFEEYVRPALERQDWRASRDSRHGQAMDMRWREPRPSQLLSNGEFTESAFLALRRWQAFRGSRERVTLPHFQSVLRQIDPQELDRFADLTIVNFDFGKDGPGLLRLFRQCEAVKPTKRKWVAVSKTLYLLLPDLVPPMDRSTWTFLGRSVPVGLDEAHFRTAYGAFSKIAKGVSGRGIDLQGFAQGEENEVKLGLGRIVDFAVLGSLK
jgi:hypothetical protein